LFGNRKGYNLSNVYYVLRIFVLKIQKDLSSRIKFIAQKPLSTERPQ
jgi:hypothetical protein